MRRRWTSICIGLSCTLLQDSRQETCLNAPILEMKIEPVKSMMIVNSPARVSVSVSLKTLRTIVHLNLSVRGVYCTHLSADVSIIVRIESGRESRTMRNGRRARLIEVDWDMLFGHSGAMSKMTRPDYDALRPKDCATEKSPHDPDGVLGMCF